MSTNIPVDWDMFFYYGEGVMEQQIENEYDIWQGLLQPTRSLLYFRQDGAGIEKNENAPNTLALIITIRFNIIKWVAYRNGYVSDGREGLPDRRIATSQQTISITQDNIGNMNISVYYIPFFNIETIKNTVLTI